MFLEAKVTEIYCLTDDFCKEYWFIKPLKAWPLVENVPWDGSSGSSCTW